MYSLYCGRGCAIFAEGIHRPQLILNIFTKTFKINIDRSTVVINNSTFLGSMAFLSGGALSCIQSNLNLSNCVFKMSEKSKPPNDGGFTYYENSLPYSSFSASNIVLDARDYKNPSSLVTAAATIFEIESLEVLCPVSYKPIVRNQTLVFLLSCEITCPGEYTFQAGNTLMDMKYRTDWKLVEYDFNLFATKFHPLCFPCPVGANCTNGIKPIPNYWGFGNQNDFVTMIRCPKYFCCQKNEIVPTLNPATQEEQELSVGNARNLSLSPGFQQSVFL